MLTASNFITCFIVIYLWGGILLYNYLHIGLIDELLVALLFLYTLCVKYKHGKIFLNKEFGWFMLVSFFYLAYSCAIKTNTLQAALMDYQQEVKPYVTFYCAYMLRPVFSSLQCKVIRRHCLAIFVVALLNMPAYGGTFMESHPTMLAALSTLLFLFYLYFSDRSHKATLRAWLMFTYGWLSGRSKFFATYIATAVLWKKKGKFRLSDTRTFVGMVLTGIVIVVVIWEKINFYVVAAFAGEELTARAALYVASFSLLKDFFPFGSGLGTFATHASRVYYSPLYYQYNLSHVWGLSRDMSEFIADTFFPVLAQFGVVGILLFCLFWWKRYLQLKNLSDLNDYKIGLVILLVICIESFADTTLLSSRGVGYCLLLGVLLGKPTSAQNREVWKRL